MITCTPKKICGAWVLRYKRRYSASTRLTATCAPRDSKLTRSSNATRMRPKLNTRAGELIFLRTNQQRLHPHDPKVLHHDPDLLRQRASSHWPRVHDHRLRHDCAPSTPAGR